MEGWYLMGYTTEKGLEYSVDGLRFCHVGEVLCVRNDIDILII